MQTVQKEKGHIDRVPLKYQQQPKVIELRLRQPTFVSYIPDD